MPDRDNVIDGLEEIMLYNGKQMFYNDIFIRGIACDAIALLKEQEAIIEQYHRADGFLAAHGWSWEGR